MIWAILSKQVNLIVAQSESSFASMHVKKHITDPLRSRNVSVFTVLERCYVKGVKILQHIEERLRCRREGRAEWRLMVRSKVLL